VPMITADDVFKRQQDLVPRPSLVPVLKEMYAPEVTRIAKLLGRDLKRWVEGFGAGHGPTPPPRHEVIIGGTGHIAVNEWLGAGLPAAPPPAPPSGQGHGAAEPPA